MILPGFSKPSPRPLVCWHFLAGVWVPVEAVASS